MKPFWEITDAEVETLPQGHHLAPVDHRVLPRRRLVHPLPDPRRHAGHHVPPQPRSRASARRCRSPKAGRSTCRRRSTTSLDQRTNPTWPTTWFAPNLTGERPVPRRLLGDEQLGRQPLRHELRPHRRRPHHPGRRCCASRSTCTTCRRSTSSAPAPGPPSAPRIPKAPTSAPAPTSARCTAEIGRCAKAQRRHQWTVLDRKLARRDQGNGLRCTELQGVAHGCTGLCTRFAPARALREGGRCRVGRDSGRTRRSGARQERG